jgi:hypothetical protein
MAAEMMVSVKFEAFSKSGCMFGSVIREIRKAEKNFRSPDFEQEVTEITERDPIFSFLCYLCYLL